MGLNCDHLDHSVRMGQRFFPKGGALMGKECVPRTIGHLVNTSLHTMGFYEYSYTQTNPISFAEQKWLSSLDRWGNWCQRGKAGPEVMQLISSWIRIQMLISWIQVSYHEREWKISWTGRGRANWILCVRATCFLVWDDLNTANSGVFLAIFLSINLWDKQEYELDGLCSVSAW